MNKLLIIVLTACTMSACRNVSKLETPVIVAEKVPDTLTYTYDSVVVYSKNIIKTDQQSSDTTSAKIFYPVFKDQSLNNLVRKRVTDYISDGAPNVAYIDMANSFVAGYDDYFQESKENPQSWYLTIDIDVIYQQPNYISLSYTTSDYSGGAHPNTNSYFINYNPKTHQAISLDSLINASQKSKLVKLAETIFRKDEKLTADESLDGKYFFKDAKFSLPENFYVNTNGLVFVYNPYEIKAYVYGSTELTIPFAALQSIAKPNTILTIKN